MVEIRLARRRLAFKVLNEKFRNAVREAQ